FAVIEDAENEGRILILHAKNNLAPPQKGLAFRIEQHLVADGVIGSAIHFESEHVAVSADEALAANHDANTGTGAEEAAELLSIVLAAGALPVAKIEEEARAAGLLGKSQPLRQSKPFRTARKQLGVITRKDGMS